MSSPNAQSDDLASGVVARAAGISTDTLRHYERRGLLPPPRRLSNGYRRFPRNAIGRVLLIQRALVMGFSLDELARILRSRDRGRPPCEEVRALGKAKLEQLERQIKSLVAFRDQLQRTLAEWDQRLESRGSAGEPARLLESLSEALEPVAPASAIWRGPRFDRRARSANNAKE